ncbi:hypothetical protein [Pseudoalteromonas luteoviolacea]|uniref:hypothetical protein n=1 Tax=Pseudoalteromonas luteoviolacea TaxID=43657 RepID=UPI00210ECA2F|nr:hypothetical protein [Pseudoalteromonas luteoviolacea]
MFASYPIVQLMTPPSVAMKPVSPKKSLAVAAALFAMIFTSAAILMVNKRREIVALVVEKPKAKA